MVCKLWFTVEAASGHKYPAHPECPERVQAVQQYLDTKLRLGDCAEACQLRDFRTVAKTELLAVHSRGYLEELQTSLGKVTEAAALRDLDDPDGCTFATPSTWDDAIKAASSAVALVDILLSSHAGAGAESCGGGGDGSSSPATAAAPEGTAACAFSICRPPGHHATPSEGMGFCLLNSAALAARHAQRAHGLQRVMILDVDVHHGNGTQDIFYEDPSVLFVDVHQAGVWPGSGAAEEVGAGLGEGATINVPLPWHSGHSAMQRAVEAVVAPAAKRFRPQLIIVSAGYDAHWRDPLEKMQLQSATYHWLAEAVAGLARELCGGRCLWVLEGGYHQEALAESVGETMLGLLGCPPATPVLDTVSLPGAEPEPLEAAEAAIQRVRQLHGLA